MYKAFITVFSTQYFLNKKLIEQNIGMVLIVVIIAKSEEAKERMQEDIQESGLGTQEDIREERNLNKVENKSLQATTGM